MIARRALQPRASFEWGVAVSNGQVGHGAELSYAGVTPEIRAAIHRPSAVIITLVNCNPQCFETSINARTPPRSTMIDRRLAHSP